MSKKQDKTKDDENESGLSVMTVTIGVVIVILFFGWGAMASSYAQSIPANMDDLELTTMAGGGIIGGILFMITGIVWFFINAFAQIPNIISVFSYSFRYQLAIPICTIIVAILAVLGGFGMKMAEGHLDDPYRKHRESRADVRERVGVTGESRQRRRKKKKAKRKKRPESD